MKTIEQHAVTEKFYYALLLNFHQSLQEICKLISLQPVVVHPLEPFLLMLPSVLEKRPDLKDMVFMIPQIGTFNEQKGVFDKWFVVKHSGTQYIASFKVAIVEYGGLAPATCGSLVIAVPTTALLMEIE